MSDQQPNEPAETAEPAGDAAAAGDAAEQALRAAQAAVSNLKEQTGAVEDRGDAALKAAQAAIAQAKAGNRTMGGGAPAGPAPLPIPEFSPAMDGAKAAGLDLLSDVNLNVKVELGRTRMYVEDILRLGPGSVVELDKLAGDPVDIYVNERHVARGEVLVLNDNFCVRVNEIIAESVDKK